MNEEIKFILAQLSKAGIHDLPQVESGGVSMLVSNEDLLTIDRKPPRRGCLLDRNPSISDFYRRNLLPDRKDEQIPWTPQSEHYAEPNDNQMSPALEPHRYLGIDLEQLTNSQGLSRIPWGRSDP